MPGNNRLKGFHLNQSVLRCLERSWASKAKYGMWPILSIRDVAETIIRWLWYRREDLIKLVEDIVGQS